MIKRISAILASVLLTVSVLCSCAVPEEAQSLHIVCTSFAQYDWTRSITGGCDGIKLTLLLDSATDMHSYQASAKDIVTISSADIFIYTGGDSDVWAEDVLGNTDTSSVTVINLMQSLGEENLYCIEAEEEHDHGEDGHHHTHDEHIWLSPKKAILLCESITEALSAQSPENEHIFEKNLAEYKTALEQLDKKITDITKKAAKNTVLIADRFPFLYLTQDYSLEYCAAFTGCSAETEVSAATLIKLVEKADELSLDTVLITETSNADLARTVKDHVKNKATKILVLNSIQSIKDKDSVTYIDLMEENCKVLEEALS